MNDIATSKTLSTNPSHDATASTSSPRVPLSNPGIQHQQSRKTPYNVVDGHRREKDIINACLESRSGSVSLYSYILC